MEVLTHENKLDKVVFKEKQGETPVDEVNYSTMRKYTCSYILYKEKNTDKNENCIQQI